MPEKRQGKGRGGRGADGRSTASGRGNHYTPTNRVTKSGLPPFNEKTWKQTSTSSTSSKAESLKKLQADQAKLKKSFTKSFATISGKIDELVKAKRLKAKRRKKLHADQAKLKKSLATITGMIDELVNASSDPDTTESDDCQEESAHFQFGDERGFMMAQHDLDLKNIILLDTQSTVDLFCNQKLVQQVSKSDKPMRVQSNGGTIQVTHKATMRGYKHDIWFSKHALTNILSLSNLIQQYRVTYDSTAQTFVVHRETHRKPNMLFKMHANGLHYFDPCDAAFLSMTNDQPELFTLTDRKGRTVGEVELPGVDGDEDILHVDKQLPDNIVDAEATDDSIEIDDAPDHSPNGETVHEAANQTEPTIEPDPLDRVETVYDYGEEVAVQLPGVDGDATPSITDAEATVIEMGNDQPELFTFTDRKGRTVGEVELPGVDGDEDIPHVAIDETTDDQIEINDDDLDYSPRGEPKIEQIQELEPSLESYPAVTVGHADNHPAEKLPYVQAPTVQEPIQAPDGIPGVARATSRTKFATKQSYVKTDRRDRVLRQVELQGVDGDLSPNIADAEATDDSIEIDDDLHHSPNGETVQEAGNQTEPTIEPDPLDEVETVYDYGEEVAVHLPGVDGNAAPSIADAEAPSIADAEAPDDPIAIDDSNICLNGNTELKQTKAIDPHIDPQPDVKVDEVDNEPDAQFQDVPAPTVTEPVQAPDGIPGVRRSTKACFGSLFIVPKPKTNNKSHKKQGDRLVRHG